jgi:hypothetical protein
MTTTISNHEKRNYLNELKKYKEVTNESIYNIPILRMFWKAT